MSAEDVGEGSRTILWCVPRAISSALAKCLAFIDSNEVWFEPFAYCSAAQIHYNLHTNIPKRDMPTEYEGNEEVFQKMKELVDAFLQTNTNADLLSYGSAKRRLEATTAKHVFVKDMAFGMTDGFHHFLPKGYRHTFLIRNPMRSIQSYRKVICTIFSQSESLQGEMTDEKAFDVERDDPYLSSGYFVKEVYDLWKYLKEHDIEPNPIIIDGDDLLTKPAETLKAYCNAVGLPYNDSLLEWDASTEVLTKMKAAGDNIVTDAVNFYGTAMKSSRFLPPSEFPSRDQLTPDVVRCADKVMKYYDEMYEFRLKV